MIKRLIALGLAAATLFLCGCSAVFKKEYLSVSEYTDEEHNEFRRDAADIAEYDELKSALNKMIVNHVDVERLLFTNYDGDLQNDLAQACGEVKEDTALGSFCVEYVASYPQRILTYYEATITINYKRSKAEVDAIFRATSRVNLQSILSDSMSELAPYAAIKMTGSDLTEAEISAAVSRAFGSNPLSCIFLPKITVALHPASGINRIVEINFSYDRSRTALNKMRTELELAVSNMTAGLDTEQPPAFALGAYNALAAACVYDPDASIRAQNPELDPEHGGTVYGALAEGLGDSRAIALAYSALCRAANIECLVVSGTFNKLEHSWNIIKLGDSYHHVDVSVDKILGRAGAFLRSDAQMQGSYWWNIEDYPECDSVADASAALNTTF